MHFWHTPIVVPRALRTHLALVIVVVSAACGSSTPPGTPSPGPGGADTITGRERLGWDQPAGSAAEVAGLGFYIYVDNVRNEATDVNCASTAGAGGFACSSRLPAMTNGAHTLEISAYVRSDPDAESTRSPALRVTVAAATAGDGDGDSAGQDWADGGAGLTSDGVPLAVERVADGLQDPVDAVFATDGRLFIAERAGRIRVVRDGTLQQTAALALADVPADGGLLAIAADPGFASNQQLFTLAAVTGSSGTLTFRLARYREVRGILAQRAVLAEAPAPPHASGAMRFGPDGKLYIALSGTGADAPSSYLGKILRVNPDGTTPRDSARTSPIWSAGHIAPRALAWQAAGGRLWIADAGSTPSSIAALDTTGRPASAERWGLPADMIPGGMAFYRGDALPELRGDLLVASTTTRHILRVRFAPDDPGRAVATEFLLKDRVGAIALVLTGPDGAIYFCTPTTVGRLTAADRR
jgi:glucose/arabinose dehydrogenase